MGLERQGADGHLSGTRAAAWLSPAGFPRSPGQSLRGLRLARRRFRAAIDIRAKQAREPLRRRLHVRSRAVAIARSGPFLRASWHMPGGIR